METGQTGDTARCQLMENGGRLLLRAKRRVINQLLTLNSAATEIGLPLPPCPAGWRSIQRRRIILLINRPKNPANSYYLFCQKKKKEMGIISGANRFRESLIIVNYR